MNGKALLAPLVFAALVPAGHAALRPGLAPVPGDAPALAAALAPAPRSLNDATAQDLAALPGMGMKSATVLLQARPAGGFRGWAEVDAVKGVGPARLKQLRERFTLP